MRLPVLILLAAASPAAAVDLTVESVLAVARPSAERLAVESFLTAAARELSLSRGIALEGVALTAEAGPRRSPQSDGSDFALGLELPLAGDRAEREAALDLFAEAEQVLPAAAELEAGLELRLAYVDAWEATVGLELAERQAASAESWLQIVEMRVAAGAEAPYETALVAAEVGLARLALADARAQKQLAWSELQARATVKTVPTRLAEPLPATPGLDAREVGDADEPVLAVSTMTRAIELRSELTQALILLDAARRSSRWSFLATAAQEGEEDIARLGVGYRLPFAGQSAARATARDAALAEGRRGGELERARLEGRMRGAEERAAALAGRPLLSTQEIEDALAALEARVTTGRDRPSAVLPLRRQLVGALLTEVAARAAHARAVFQLQALQAEIAQ
ncbi:MAG: TolC family protein [Thermoanaerobaculia bacterium]